jgi:hypothetical protein
MKPNFARLLENILFAAERPRTSEPPETDAEVIAKSRRNVAASDKLDKWLVATIAELSDRKRAA